MFKVLATTAMEMNSTDIASMSPLATCYYAIVRFVQMFFGSAFLGCAIGILSALVCFLLQPQTVCIRNRRDFQLYKHVHIRKTPALEMALMLVFAYLPYGLAEALSLSGVCKV